MPRVVTRGPSQTECSLDLAQVGAVLVGRNPDPSAADAPDAHVGAPMPVRLAAPSISANHALVWLEGDCVCVRDLDSKNGTWLRLPSGQTVRVGAGDVELDLARTHEPALSEDEPSAPVWSHSRSFGAAVARSLERWLCDQAMDARVAVVARGSGSSAPPTRIPLGTGEDLDIVPLATAHADWARLLERVWRWVAYQNALFESEEATRSEGLILASRAIRSAHRDVVEAAQGGARTLLLTGPSGSGKEVLADVFHRSTGRSGPFIAVNCSMFSKELLRSELFGAAAGAFTDGKQRILGAVERAQGGTLFLDEVGEMGLEIQPMLLRFLDRREFQSLGHYGRTQQADVRIVAATNRDLREAVREGGFRADLWYRLSVQVVDVPSLRERWDDLIAYLDSAALDDGRGSLRDALSPEALELLRGHSWDGNFRELSNFVQRLPRNVLPGAIDVAACRRALERGALSSTRLPPPDAAIAEGADWAALASRATDAFVEDRGGPPRTWDDQKEWNEKYLKPLLFFYMSGAGDASVPLDEGALSSLASQLATRMQADRGTAAKQLARYFERFRR